MEGDDLYNFAINDCYVQHLEKRYFGCRFPWNRRENSEYGDRVCVGNASTVERFKRIASVRKFSVEILYHRP